MQRSKPLLDPMGNTVWFPLPVTSLSEKKYKAISAIITAPVFIIRVKNKTLYFFRLVATNRNMLIEARMVENKFIVNACVENPSAEYILALLRKGSLYFFG